MPKRTKPLGTGGCDFVADPNKPAVMAKVRWRPEIDPGTIVLSALQQDWRLPASVPFSGAGSSPMSDDAESTDYAHHQIWMTGEPSDNQSLGALIPLDDMLPQRLAAVLVKWQRMRDEAVRLPPEITPQRRTRLILGLRALDAAADGCSHREIARGLFGSSRIPMGAAWKSHHLRSRTIRLIAGARSLRDGGYRTLLGSGQTVRL